MAKSKETTAEKFGKKLIEACEKAGRLPWQKPWEVLDEWHVNKDSGKAYQGGNQMMLMMVAEVMGWGSNEWATIKQINKMGGKVKKGEKGTMLTYWNTYEKKNEVDSNGKPKKVWFMNAFTVFNMEQQEGIEWEKEERPPLQVPEEIDQNMVKKVLENSAIVKYNGTKAAYAPDMDLIMMPPSNTFKSADLHYVTLFHECAHSTGHVSRLKRDLTGAFGSQAYAKEELIAEISAALLAHVAGVKNTEANTKAYLQSWLKRLKKHPEMITSAISKAAKVFEYYNGTSVVERAA